MMSASAFCQHSSLKTISKAERFLDSNIRIFQVRVECIACGQVFRSIGVHGGMSIDAPSTPDDGETMVIPFVPANEEPDMSTREMLAS
jgi:hypothetical protein